jgi:hypothetical protein
VPAARASGAFGGKAASAALLGSLLGSEPAGCERARQYVLYFNKARPHQGIGQRIPDASANDNHDGKIIAIPVLGGLHHDYQRAA